ncbi:hypothetical protein WJX74_002036 [Apatococcus lobatus]|uniref:V-type proton ATPase subunit D n=1 Tax=Apatococcus lobatus TaxID=904363 RepID=A0AAW1SDR5_9CHLO
MSGSGNRLNVVPTVSVLAVMKSRLSGAVKGHSLLKKKADALTMRFRQILKTIVQTKEEMGKKFRQSAFALTEAKYAAGDFRHTVLDNVEQASVKVNAQQDNVAGVKLPKFERANKEASGNSEGKMGLTGLGSGGKQIQTCRQSFLTTVDLLIELASLQTAFLTLDEEIKKTNRRVNALDNVVRPRLENTISYIKGELDELEREEFFRLKKVQGKKQRDAEANVDQDALREQGEAMATGRRPGSGKKEQKNMLDDANADSDIVILRNAFSIYSPSRVIAFSDCPHPENLERKPSLSKLSLAGFREATGQQARKWQQLFSVVKQHLTKRAGFSPDIQQPKTAALAAGCECRTASAGLARLASTAGAVARAFESVEVWTPKQDYGQQYQQPGLQHKSAAQDSSHGHSASNAPDATAKYEPSATCADEGPPAINILSSRPGKSETLVAFQPPLAVQQQPSGHATSPHTPLDQYTLPTQQAHRCTEEGSTVSEDVLHSTFTSSGATDAMLANFAAVHLAAAPHAEAPGTAINRSKLLLDTGSDISTLEAGFHSQAQHSLHGDGRSSTKTSPSYIQGPPTPDRHSEACRTHMKTARPNAAMALRPEVISEQPQRPSEPSLLRAPVEPHVAPAAVSHQSVPAASSNAMTYNASASLGQPAELPKPSSPHLEHMPGGATASRSHGPSGINNMVQDAPEGTWQQMNEPQSASLPHDKQQGASTVPLSGGHPGSSIMASDASDRLWQPAMLPSQPPPPYPMQTSDAEPAGVNPVLHISSSIAMTSDASDRIWQPPPQLPIPMVMQQCQASGAAAAAKTAAAGLHFQSSMADSGEAPMDGQLTQGHAGQAEPHCSQQGQPPHEISPQTIDLHAAHCIAGSHVLQKIASSCAHLADCNTNRSYVSEQRIPPTGSHRNPMLPGESQTDHRHQHDTTSAARCPTPNTFPTRAASVPPSLAAQQQARRPGLSLRDSFLERYLQLAMNEHPLPLYLSNLPPVADPVTISEGLQHIHPNGQGQPHMPSAAELQADIWPEHSTFQDDSFLESGINPLLGSSDSDIIIPHGLGGAWPVGHNRRNAGIWASRRSDDDLAMLFTDADDDATIMPGAGLLDTSRDFARDSIAPCLHSTLEAPQQVRPGDNYMAQESRAAPGFGRRSGTPRQVRLGASTLKHMNADAAQDYSAATSICSSEEISGQVRVGESTLDHMGGDLARDSMAAPSICSTTETPRQVRLGGSTLDHMDAEHAAWAAELRRHLLLNGTGQIDMHQAAYSQSQPHRLGIAAAAEGGHVPPQPRQPAGSVSAEARVQSWVRQLGSDECGAEDSPSLEVLGITQAAAFLAATGQQQGQQRLDVDPLNFADGSAELRLLASFTLQQLIGPEGTITTAWPALAHQLQHQPVFAAVVQEPGSKGTLKQLLRTAEAAAQQYRAHAAFAWAFMTCAKLAASEVELPLCAGLWSQAQMAFVDEYYRDSLQAMSARHGVQVFCGLHSVLAKGKLFRMQVVRESLEASVTNLQVFQGSIIIDREQHLPRPAAPLETAAGLSGFLAEHLRSCEAKLRSVAQVKIVLERPRSLSIDASSIVAIPETNRAAVRLKLARRTSLEQADSKVQLTRLGNLLVCAKSFQAALLARWVLSEEVLEPAALSQFKFYHE